VADDTSGPGRELEARNRQIELAAKAILDGEDVDGIRSDPEAATRMILERILNAETFEDAFAPQTLTPWRELMGVPVKVGDFRFNRSGFTAGSPIYAVVDLTLLDSGELTTVTVGGRNVLAQLLVMLKHGWQDNPVAMASKQTGEGYDVLWLVPAGEAPKTADDFGEDAPF